MIKRTVLLALLFSGQFTLTASAGISTDTVVSRLPNSSNYYPTIALGVATILTWRDEGFMSRGAVYEWRQKNYSTFNTKTDTYLQFVPAGAFLLTEFFQSRNRSHMKNSVVNFIKAEGLMVVMVHSIKQLARVERPGSENLQSFPSGHTAQAFLSATYLHRELMNPRYDDLKSRKWLITGGYVLATATGSLRIMNNEHWVTDVLAGAAIGILAGNLAYDIFPGKRDHSTKLTVAPFWNGAGGVSVTALF